MVNVEWSGTVPVSRNLESVCISSVLECCNCGRDVAYGVANGETNETSVPEIERRAGSEQRHRTGNLSRLSEHSSHETTDGRSGLSRSSSARRAIRCVWLRLSVSSRLTALCG